MRIARISASVNRLQNRQSYAIQSVQCSVCFVFATACSRSPAMHGSASAYWVGCASFFQQVAPDRQLTYLAAALAAVCACWRSEVYQQTWLRDNMRRVTQAVQPQFKLFRYGANEGTELHVGCITVHPPEQPAVRLQ